MLRNANSIQCGMRLSCFALLGRPNDAVLDYHVYGLCFGVCVLGWTERSCRCYTGLAFRKTSIFPDLSCLLLIRHVAREFEAIRSTLGLISEGPPPSKLPLAPNFL
jgi:hypothetical protein